MSHYDFIGVLTLCCPKLNGLGDIPTWLWGDGSTGWYFNHHDAKNWSDAARILWQGMTRYCQLSPSAVILSFGHPPVAESLFCFAHNVAWHYFAKTIKNREKRSCQFSCALNLNSYHKRPETVSNQPPFFFSFDLFTKSGQLGYISFVIHQHFAMKQWKD